MKVNTIKLSFEDWQVINTYIDDLLKVYDKKSIDLKIRQLADGDLYVDLYARNHVTVNQIDLHFVISGNKHEQFNTTRN